MKQFWFMTVSKVHFKCNNPLCVQKNVLAMGAFLVLILVNLWLKNYEKVLAIDIPQKSDFLGDINRKMPKCNRRVTFRNEAVEFEDFLN